MYDNIFDVGSVVIYSILVTGLSVKNLGCVSSLFSLFCSAVINICSGRVETVEQFFLKAWFQQLSFCCLISVTSVGLAKFMEYYDSGQNYIHLIPTTSMPMLLPVLVIIIISILVKLGLENSDILNMISAFVFLLSFTLFAFTAVMHSQWNFESWKIQDYLAEKFLYGVVLWYSAFSKKSSDGKPTDLRSTLITSNIYLVILVTLSILPKNQIKHGLDFISPLGDMFSLYKLFQVPLVSCSLGLALYSVFVPAVDRFFKIHSKVRNTGSNNNKNISIFNTSLVSIAIMYLFNLEQMVVLSNSSIMLGEIFEIGASLFLEYKPQKIIKKDFKFRQSLNEYRYLETNEISQEENESDSCPSSDTDIDAVVEEYKAKVKVLTSSDKQEPNLLSWALASVLFSVISLLSFVSSYAFQKSRYLDALAFFGVIVVLCLVLFLLPKNKKVSLVAYLSQMFSFTTLLIFLRGILISVWIPLSIWCLTGVFYQFKRNHKVSPQESKNYSINRIMQLPIFETTSQKVQTNKI